MRRHASTIATALFTSGAQPSLFLVTFRPSLIGRRPNVPPRSFIRNKAAIVPVPERRVWGASRRKTALPSGNWHRQLSTQKRSFASGTANVRFCQKLPIGQVNVGSRPRRRLSGHEGPDYDTQKWSSRSHWASCRNCCYTCNSLNQWLPGGGLVAVTALPACMNTICPQEGPTSQQAATFTASPPRLVSLYLDDMSIPVWRIVSIT